MFSTYKMSITPLTPIHIGTGNSLTPGDYFILEDDKDYIYVMDWGAIPDQEFDEHRDELLSWIAANPITWVDNVPKRPRLVKLIKKHVKFKSRIAKNVQKEIKSRWGQKDSKLEISTVQRTVNGLMMPGSSIKGAIRTALVWKRAPESVEIGPRDSDEWERRWLARNESLKGGIPDDILRHLKVTDAEAKSNVNSVVFLPKHIGMADDTTEMQDYKECFNRADYEKPYKFRGKLLIQDQLLRLTRNQGLLSAKDILEACKSFYSEVIKEEMYYWEEGKDAVDAAALNACERIKKYAKDHPEGALIRLGWGCGMNSIGLNMAKPNNPGHKQNPRYRHYPATRILISGFPPGWAFLQLEEG